MRITYPRMLVFDFETTGLSQMADNIIEVGAILYELKDDKYIKKETFNALIKQERPISEFISNLTHITNDMLDSDGIDEEIAFRTLDAMIDDQTLCVAYNLAFDIGFLLKLYQKYVSRNYSIPFDILDCMAVYKDRYPYPHRLENAAATFEITNENAHRACDDAETTFEVLMKLQELEDNLGLYVNVLGYNPKYRAPDTYFFNKPIRVIPQGMNGLRDIEKAQKG
jgi:DNA polymerase-3 subunit epsilon